MKIFLEYIIVYIIIYLFYYYGIIKHIKKYDRKNLPVELLYLKKIYKVSVREEDYNSFVHVYSFINTFIITTIYIILMYLLTNWVARIIIGIVLLLLMIIICYGLLARYYIWKEGR